MDKWSVGLVLCYHLQNGKIKISLDENESTLNNRNLRRHSSDQGELQATSTLRWKILKTKRSFIYTDRCDAHTTAGTKTELFRKRSSTCSNPRNLKTPTFRFCVHEKHFENGTFRKR